MGSVVSLTLLLGANILNLAATEHPATFTKWKMSGKRLVHPGTVGTICSSALALAGCGQLGKWWLGLVLAFVLAGDFEGPSSRDYS